MYVCMYYVCAGMYVCVYLAEWDLVGPSSLLRMTVVLRYFVLEYVYFYDRQDKGSRSHENWYLESRHWQLRNISISKH